MPWLVWFYIALVVIAAIWGAYDDRQSRRPRYWLAIDFLTTTAWLFFIAAYYHPSLATPLGRSLAPVFATTLLLTGLSVQQEIGDIDRNPDPELSPRQNFIGDMLGIGLGVAFLAPAVVFGALVVRRTWSAT